jgi:hypothetical protein
MMHDGGMGMGNYELCIMGLGLGLELGLAYWHGAACRMGDGPASWGAWAWGPAWR